MFFVTFYNMFASNLKNCTAFLLAGSHRCSMKFSCMIRHKQVKIPWRNLLKCVFTTTVTIYFDSRCDETSGDFENHRTVCKSSIYHHHLQHISSTPPNMSIQWVAVNLSCPVGIPHKWWNLGRSHTFHCESSGVRRGHGMFSKVHDLKIQVSKRANKICLKLKNTLSQEGTRETEKGLRSSVKRDRVPTSQKGPTENSDLRNWRRSPS